MHAEGIDLPRHSQRKSRNASQGKCVFFLRVPTCGIGAKKLNEGLTGIERLSGSGLDSRWLSKARNGSPSSFRRRRTRKGKNSKRPLRSLYRDAALKRPLLPPRSLIGTTPRFPLSIQLQRKIPERAHFVQDYPRIQLVRNGDPISCNAPPPLATLPPPRTISPPVLTLDDGQFRVLQRSD